jgi:hypothetical protein
VYHVPEHSEGLGSNENDDLEVVSTQASADDDIFDAIIGHIEDIFMGKNIYIYIYIYIYAKFSLIYNLLIYLFKFNSVYCMKHCFVT